MDVENVVWTRDKTNVLKGIAIIMVVLGHTTALVDGLRVLTPLGAIGVGLFLICSGYGLEKSFQLNGLSNFWKKKFKAILLPYLIIELIGLIFHPHIDIKDFILDVSLIKPLHPFGWYMQYLLVWYVSYYCSAVLFQEFKAVKFVGGGNSIQLMFLLFVTFGVFLFWDSLHAQNSLSFVTGVIIAKKNQHLSKIISYKSLILVLLISFPFIIARYFRLINDLQGTILWSCYSLFYYFSLTLLSFIITMHLSRCFKLQLLIEIGIVSYSIYLVHGYVFNLCRDISAKGLSLILIYLFVTLIGSFIFHYFVQWIQKILIYHDC